MRKYNFNKIAKHHFRHGRSRENVLHIFRTVFPKNTSGRLLLPKISDMKNDIKVLKSYFHFQNYTKNRITHFNIFVVTKHHSGNEKQGKLTLV